MSSLFAWPTLQTVLQKYRVILFSNYIIAERLSAGQKSRRVGLDLALSFYVCLYVCMYTYVLPVSHVSALSCTCACMYVSMTYVHIRIIMRTWVHV